MSNKEVAKTTPASASRLVGVMFFICSVMIAGLAAAATRSEIPPSATVAAQHPNRPKSNNIKKLDNTRIRGFDIHLPGPSDSLDPDIGGVRSALADKGIGYFGYTENTNAYDLLNHGDNVTNGEQVYNGQKYTATGYSTLFLTYDLSQYGIPNGQLTAGVFGIDTTWAPLGPSKIQASDFSYFQTLFNDKLEFKVGYLGNDFEFVGIYVGGSLVGGTLGTNASLPAQAGLSLTYNPRPGANLRFNLPDHFYDKFGVQKSVNPDGAKAEYQANPTGFGLGGAHTGWLFVDELGFRRAASPGTPEMWLRGGYVGNNSSYVSTKNPATRKNNNYMAYFLADRQVVQLGDSASDAYRGLYAGGSVMHAPKDRNLISQYYSLRLYGEGMIASRPKDLVTFVATRQVFSDFLVSNARRAGSITNGSTNSYALAYTAHIFHGLYVSGGLEFIDGPKPVTTNDPSEKGFNALVNILIYY